MGLFPPSFSRLGFGSWRAGAGWHLFKVSFKGEFASVRRGISFSLCLCLASPAEVLVAAPL